MTTKNKACYVDVVLDCLQLAPVHRGSLPNRSVRHHPIFFLKFVNNKSKYEENSREFKNYIIERSKVFFEKLDLLVKK